MASRREAAGAVWEGADLERPIPGENPESDSLEEARRWVSVYSHLVKLEQDLLDVLAGMIPLVYSLSAGAVRAVPFDAMQRQEILLTILQSVLGMLLLLNMRYSAGEALILFVLWFVQFMVPSIRGEILYVYGAFILGALVQLRGGTRNLEALHAFAHQWRTHGARPATSER